LAAWLSLFRQAMTIIDAVVAEAGPFEWTLGGGTMLRHRFHHREKATTSISS